MAALGNVKISLQVMLIGLIAFLGFAVVGVVYVNSATNQAGFLETQLHEGKGISYVNAIKAGFLQVRQAENEFLVTKDIANVEIHAQTVETLLPYFDQLKTIHPEPEEQQMIDDMSVGFASYVEQFNKTVEVWKKIGLTAEDGLRGALATAAMNVEDELTKNSELPEASDLTVVLLKMRSYEKDFFLSIESKFAKRVKRIHAKLDMGFAYTDIPEEEKESIAKILEKYIADFELLSDLMLEAVEQKKQMGELYAAVQPVLQALDEKGSADAAIATEELQASADKTLTFMIVLMIVVTVVVVALSLLIGRGVSGPVRKMTEAMTSLAGGALDTEVPARDQHNEIGEMASAVQVFKDNALEVQRLEREQKAAEERQAQEKRQMMLNMAKEFEGSVGGVVQSVSSAATQMQSSASSLSTTADEASEQSVTVAHAAEQASHNVESVASASQELSSSISEIARQVSQSTQISATAVTEVEGANAQVQGLADAAAKIGEVVALITDIADQTNLLALNATIEAARAGEAGKGFAVVASEVKNLANQTARATEEISSQIGGIQNATQDAVSAIGSIGGIINQMNEIASAIASAVEEQGAATQEIARNVEQASQGTEKVSTNIASVQTAAGNTGDSANEMLGAAKELSQQSSKLRSEVDKFLDTIRNS